MSLPHAASHIQENSRLASSNGSHDLVKITPCLTENLKSTTINDNKWINISNNIQSNIKPKSTTNNSHTVDPIDSKWTKITNTINVSQLNKLKEKNKRSRSSSTANEFDCHAQQPSKQLQQRFKKLPMKRH